MVLRFSVNEKEKKNELQATYETHKVRIHAIIYALVKIGDKRLVSSYML